jgi:type IV secretory pathway TraG/TraD family ATPase VirD4
VPEFFRPERGDLILNPLDARCLGWTPWTELRPESEAMDAEALASALLPDPANPFGQSGADFFFRESARTLIVGLLDVVRTGDPADIPKLLGLPRAKLKEALRGVPAEALIDPGAHDQGAGIIATAFNATKAFHHLPPQIDPQWSALDWAQSRKGWLFLSSTEDSRDAASPLQSVWLDCLVRRLMAAQESREQIWIVADELPVLRRQAQLESLVVRGRKRGLCAVLGFQAITQLRALYGRDRTATMAAAPATKLILRTGEPDTARWSSEQIGEREVSRTQVGASAGPREMRDGFTIHPQRVVEKAALPSEIQMLQPFQGYLCITGHRRAIVEFSYLNPIKRQPGFVPRLTTNKEPEAESAAPALDGTPNAEAGAADSRRAQASPRSQRPLA